MNRSRRGLFHRFTALLLAVAMPLCCCMLNSAAGGSCCDSNPVVEIVSCCSSTACQVEQTEELPESDPCGFNSCVCCLKAPSSTFDWNPPVDTIGTLLPPRILTSAIVAEIATDSDSGTGWGDPPPNHCEPGLLRGHVILQV
ncbi:MAG: hypothetical protein VX527_12645 [Planctomycetota bacterium]|nr:hypothetical protein [Planctomycetota bacterium]